MWGGANTLAQALLHVRDTRTPQQLDAFVSKLRVYSISDQDDAGPWIRREFPALHYIAMPSTPDGDQYYSGDVDGHQRRSLLQECAGRRFHDVHRRVGQREHPQQGAARQALSVSRAAFTRGTRRRFSGLIDNGLASCDEPDLRRVGRALRVAAVLRRDASDLDAGRRLVSRAGTIRETR